MENNQRGPVLVVEDESQTRELLTALLRQRGLDVDQADDGRAAIELLERKSYAVLILDLLLPGVDGFAVLDALRRKPADAAPVVLVITGAEAQLIERLDSQRVHGIVRKPFDAHELASLVVACSEIRARASFSTMAIATLMSGVPLLAFLQYLN